MSWFINDVLCTLAILLLQTLKVLIIAVLLASLAKNEARNLMENADLAEKGGKL